MESIGIMGTGRMGVRLALLFAEAGNRVVLGSRNRARAERIVKHLGNSSIQPGSYKEAASQPVVLPAIFLRDGLLDIIEPYRADFDGKLFIDISNPFNADYSDFILPWNTSSAEQLQFRFPQTTVVGAFKNVFWEVFDQPRFDGGAVSDIYIVGDDEGAKRRLVAMCEGSPFRYIDAGRLVNARTVERMTLLIGELGIRYGYFPRMNYRLLGEPWKPGQADRLAPIINGEREQL
ncbi:MAG TPA: NAD(P)-binding domain-containing protein [Blastocatellia bacterium]|nr:NAD(P)-binding domain-containing protein [Blastocatellia bacterium]